MDQRQTFKTVEEIKETLSHLFAAHTPVSLLIDREGLTRVEGTLLSAFEQKDPGQTSFVVNSESEMIIDVREVIAVNGVFRADYTEC